MVNIWTEAWRLRVFTELKKRKLFFSFKCEFRTFLTFPSFLYRYRIHRIALFTQHLRCFVYIKFITTFMCYFSYRLPQQSHYICHNQTFFSLVMFVSILCIYFFLPVYNTKKTYSFFSIAELILCVEWIKQGLQTKHTIKAEIQTKLNWNQNVYTIMLCCCFCYVHQFCMFVLNWFGF